MNVRCTRIDRKFSSPIDQSQNHSNVWEDKADSLIAKTRFDKLILSNEFFYETHFNKAIFENIKNCQESDFNPFYAFFSILGDLYPSSQRYKWRETFYYNGWFRWIINIHT